MNTQTLLQKLDTQVATLAADITPVAHKSSQSARFDHTLFNSHSTRLNDYLAELQQHLSQLHHVVAAQRHAQVTFLAEKIVAQISALRRELATLNLRKNTAHTTSSSKTHSRKASSSYDLYHQLAEHQEYERRLQEMIRDRARLLASSGIKIDQQQIQKEQIALEGRLQRCRQALQRIEYAIEHQ